MSYFDHAATSPILPEVLDHYADIAKSYFGNPSSQHLAGKEAKYLLEEARSIIAGLLSVSPKNIYFTSGATEAANLLIKGYARRAPKDRNQIIISAIEHAAVYQTAQALHEFGWEIKYAAVNECGLVKLPELLDLVNEKTAIVSIMSVNNEIGTMQDINSIAEVVKNKNKDIFFISDIVQAFGKISLSLNFENIDAVFVSGHKLGAPKGCGFFYLNSAVQVEPLFSGGGQEHGLRSGTTDPIAASCLAKAASIAFSDLESNYSKIQQLNEILIKQLELYNIHYQRIVPIVSASSYITALVIYNVSAHILVESLSAQGFHVSSGSACSGHTSKKSHVIDAIGLPCEQAGCVIRISFSHKTMENEVVTLVNKLRYAINE